ncbi:39 kDa initiator binding protein [Histomonas meleagridis]|uniref:39 kDa initiator binding protein n=1 Tax=Histomonas meleagridis TaxID=135588 RepID=UPI003559668E|nr:39 kDa initiator binding protein [Histomonas meleagridis]KAH0800222.1 39 kDa initiator binding protein [Histomonas meleagridis]
MEDIQNYSKAFHDLPIEIKTTLRRKSSRDPSSRFPTKLHLLLTYVTENPSLEEKIGLGWISDTEFRMNKKTLGSIMGIKLNTINVNLKDLGFEQTQRDRNGWTHWKREGFTKSNAGLITTNPKPQSAIPDNSEVLIRFPTPDVSEISVTIDFNRIAQNAWQSIVGGNYNSFQSSRFIEMAAQYLKHNEQPQDNAENVLRALIAPCRIGLPTVTKTDFFRFLAMFGPPSSSMVKIAGLLEHSNNTGNWLSFTPEAQEPNTFYAAFDNIVPNCLVFHKANVTNETFRVYNIPTVEVSQGSYLVDQNGRFYDSWANFFSANPGIIETMSINL